MSRVLLAFAALGSALVTAQKFPAQPIPRTLSDRVDQALEELEAAAAEEPGFAFIDGADGAPTFEERLAKLELAMFGDGDKEDSIELRLDDLEEAFTGVEKAAELLKTAPSIDDLMAGLAARVEALEQAATEPAAASAEEPVKPAAGEGGGKTKTAGGPAESKLV